MSSIIRFCVQFLIVFVPIVSGTLLLAFFERFSRLEVALISLLMTALPWLFYELMARSEHQHRANKALLHFCNSLEKVFSSMSVIEKKSEEHPRALMAELKLLQGIMHQISIEKEETITASNQTQINLGSTYNKTVQQPNPRAAANTTQKGQTSTQSAPQKKPASTKPIPSAEIVELSPKAKNKKESVSSEIEGETDAEVMIETNRSLTRNELLTVIETALSSDHIEMLVQPIVSLPQRKARHFECFSRIRTPDGNIFTPDHFVHLAEEENLIRLLDNAMLFRCIQMARASVTKKFDVNFFCNVSQHTLSDKFFFNSLIEFFHSNRELGRNIILEFHETAIIEKIDELEPLFRKLKLYDCRFSVDQVTNLNLNVKKLKALNFKYIKFNSESLIHKLHTEEGIKDIKAFKQACNAQNLDVIVSHVEDEKTLIEMNDFHFDFGQGYLFGSPVLSKA